MYCNTNTMTEDLYNLKYASPAKFDNLIKKYHQILASYFNVLLDQIRFLIFKKTPLFG